MKGDLPIAITWLLNGKEIRDESDGITILKVSPRLSSLSIESMDHRHRGEFKCMAKNKAGHAEFTTELKINGT